MTEPCFEQIADQGSDAGREWETLSRDEAAPFIHRFQTARRSYVYDVNTGRIVQTGPVVWDIVEDFARLGDERVLAGHVAAHGADAVAAAMREITAARDKGLFLSHRVAQIVPCDAAKVREQLASHRGQLILNITEQCNFRCSYCVYDGRHEAQRSHAPRNMQWETARAAIDDFLAHSKDTNAPAISFYGGEPLLNLPLIRQCVDHVRKDCGRADVLFAMTTNGALLEGEAADLLAAERFQIMVSLDGPADAHDRNRRTRDGRPTWQRVTENVQRFLEDHPDYKTNGRLRFNAVVTPSTDLREVQRFFETWGPLTDDMGLGISPENQPADGQRPLCPTDPLAQSRDEVYAAFIARLKGGQVARSHNSRANWVATAAFEQPFTMFHKRKYLSPHLPKKLLFTRPCVPGARRTFVTADGDYFACERVPADGEGIIGNVREGVIPEKVIALLERWHAASAGQCRWCWCLPMCMVGCFATVREGGKLTPAAKQRACAAHRRNMHKLLVEYCGVLEENPKAFDYAKEIVFA
ncbi:MAG: radical SAM protein [Phycisphaerae bacterium]